ncbi:MAG: hypothetical protein AT713_01570 [Caldivirga sp. JCHS_4]|jgi:hypothetical protein|nr:MAG: hypothetical protein AT713_01570 [Caldivirga sp. JCHS_4]
MATKPDLNIIIVVLDSLRQDHVGFYRSIQGISSIFDGVKPPETPNLDQINGKSHCLWCLLFLCLFKVLVYWPVFLLLIMF